MRARLKDLAGYLSFRYLAEFVGMLRSSAVGWVQKLSLSLTRVHERIAVSHYFLLVMR